MTKKLCIRYCGDDKCICSAKGTIMDLSSSGDFGFSDEFMEEPATGRDKAAEIAKLVIPLINNLMKNADKDIHWPGREKKLKELKEKIQSILDS